MEQLYKQLIEECGVCELKSEATRLFQEMKKAKVEPSIDTINAYFHACGRAIVGRSSFTKAEDVKALDVATVQKVQKIRQRLTTAVIDLTNTCPNPACATSLQEEELISGWGRNLNTYTVKCLACAKDFIPNLEIKVTPDKTKRYYFLFPPLFLKEVANLAEFKTSAVFYTVGNVRSL